MTVEYAVLFPGQGSQSAGMGGDLFDHLPHLLGEPADDVLGWSLRGICVDGPESELTRTEYAQPALYAISYALWELWAAEASASPAAAAGHSLGEYTALAAAGALDFFDGLALVAARGRAMAAAADAAPSGMAALIGADLDTADALAGARRGDGGSLWVANINAPGQVVVAGGADDIEWLVGNARDHGVRRAVPLKVAGAFHSPFMESAAEALSEAIAAVDFREPTFPVWANATARPHRAPIGDALRDQLTSPVRFSDSLRNMAAAGSRAFVHIGPGDVTAGLARRSVEGAEAPAVSNAADVSSVASALRSVSSREGQDAR